MWNLKIQKKKNPTLNIRSRLTDIKNALVVTSGWEEAICGKGSGRYK